MRRVFLCVAGGYRGRNVEAGGHRKRNVNEDPPMSPRPSPLERVEVRARAANFPGILGANFAQKFPGIKTSSLQNRNLCKTPRRGGIFQSRRVSRAELFTRATPGPRLF